MIFKFGSYIADIDVEKTKLAYKNKLYVSEGCLCQGCRNFEKAIQNVSEEVEDFFNGIGVDLKKASNVFLCCQNDEKTILYNGFYHICGEILQGENAWTINGKTEKAITKFWNDEETFKINNEFQISLSDECVLLDEEFPLPAFQLDFFATLDWAIDEECKYR